MLRQENNVPNDLPFCSVSVLARDLTKCGWDTHMPAKLPDEEEEAEDEVELLAHEL